MGAPGILPLTAFRRGPLELLAPVRSVLLLNLMCRDCEF